MATSFNNIYEAHHKCIPFYESVTDQYNQSFDVVFEQKCFWSCPFNQLLPFQITRMKRPSTDFTLKLVSKNGTIENITADLDDDQLLAFTCYGKDIIQFFGTQEFDLDCGVYYYQFSDGVETWYSDWFEIYDEEVYIDKELAITGDMYLYIGEPTNLNFTENNIDLGGNVGGIAEQQKQRNGSGRRGYGRN